MKIRYLLLSVAFLAADGLSAAVLDPLFSCPGGWQKSPVTLELQAEGEPEAVIYYTLDGSIPEIGKSQRYSAPLSLTKTTPVSVLCVDAQGWSGAVKTQTYLFLGDILRQPAHIEGYPDGWSYKSDKEFFEADYEMDPAVCFAPEYQDLMDSAFLAVPSICLVTHPGHLFSQAKDTTGGIYIHTGKSVGGLGQGWERPASMEYYDPATGGSFQINCGLRLHGGNSRNPQNSPKHSFRVSFRSQYGSSKLKYRIFPDSTATRKFDHLVLRAGYNYTWIKNGSKSLYPQNIVQRTDAQYIYDSFAKEEQLAMGHPATHRRFAHLFLNGLYWGLYEISEKINNDFAQAYLGGKDEDIDVMGDHNELIDGTWDVYDEMYKTATAVTSKANDANYKKLIDNQLLDLDNFIDYMLINWYIGNGDWDSNNWRVARNRVNPGKGFCHFVWDAETAFTDVSISKVNAVNGNPTKMMKALKQHPEFKMLCADHIYRQFFNGGPLSPEGAAAVYRRLCDEIDLPIICESARWGDYRKKITKETDDTYTRNGFWLPRQQAIFEDYFPLRPEFMLDELISAGLYPTLNPPVFKTEEGSYIADGLNIEMDFGTMPYDLSRTMQKGGTIYFTTDGSDPREAYTAKVAANAQTYGSPWKAERSADDTLSLHVKARTYKNGQWSALSEASYTLLPKPDALPSFVRSVDLNVVASKESLRMELPQSARLTLRIFSTDGRPVHLAAPIHLPQGEAVVNLPELPSGVYLYELLYCPDGSSSFRSLRGRIVL